MDYEQLRRLIFTTVLSMHRSFMSGDSALDDTSMISVRFTFEAPTTNHEIQRLMTLIIGAGYYGLIHYKTLPAMSTLYTTIISGNATPRDFWNYYGPSQQACGFTGTLGVEAADIYGELIESSIRAFEEKLLPSITDALANPSVFMEMAAEEIAAEEMTT
jgi:hypothetical protein